MDDDKLVLHGRRRNATALGSKGTGSARLPRQPEFLLALKPGTLPGDIDTNELHKVRTLLLYPLLAGIAVPLQLPHGFPVKAHRLENKSVQGF